MFDTSSAPPRASGAAPRRSTRDLALRSVGDGTLEALSLLERTFVLLPLMHSERLDLHKECVAQYERLVELARERSPENLRFFEGGLGFARRHHDIVERFGRFPHRNAALGRTSTGDEMAFMLEPGSRF